MELILNKTNLNHYESEYIWIDSKNILSHNINMKISIEIVSLGDINVLLTRRTHTELKLIICKIKDIDNLIKNDGGFCLHQNKFKILK